MLEWVSPGRNYQSEIIAAMTLAFDTVCRSLLAKESDSDDVRRKLALIILRHTDQGERDPSRLADLSFRELMGLLDGGDAMTASRCADNLGRPAGLKLVRRRLPAAE